MKVTTENNPLLSDSESVFDDEKDATLPGAVFNLTNTIIGGGILALPFAFMEAGIVSAIVLLVVCAGLVFYSSVLLFRTSMSVYGRSSSYREISQKAFGEKFGASVVDLSILIFLMGALTAYIIIIGNALTPAVSDMGVIPLKRSNIFIIITAAITIFILVPLSSTKNIKSLQYTSFIALIAILIMSASVVYYGMDRISQFGLESPSAFGNGFNGIFLSFPIISFAYTFHTSLFPVWNELKDRSTRTITISTGIAVLSCMLLYIIVGLMGYLTFYTDTPGNILDEYQNSLVFDLIRVFYSLVIAFSYPVLHYAARDSADALFFSKPTPTWRRIFITMTLTTINYIIAIVIPDIEIIFAFAGATVGQFIIYIMPALFYILLVDESNYEISTEGFTYTAGESCSYFFHPKKIPAILIVLAGILFGCFSIAEIISGFYTVN